MDRTKSIELLNRAVSDESAPADAPKGAAE